MTAPWRVLLDTNILISYLLSPPDSLVAGIVEAGILGRYVLLLPEALLDELAARAASKPYLADRIHPDEVAALAETLTEVGETISRITFAIPAVTRDPKDDYLLAYALVGRADYLVTGDRDLLVLGQVEGTRIVAVRAFGEALEKG